VAARNWKKNENGRGGRIETPRDETPNGHLSVWYQGKSCHRCVLRGEFSGGGGGNGAEHDLLRERELGRSAY